MVGVDEDWRFSVQIMDGFQGECCLEGVLETTSQFASVLRGDLVSHWDDVGVVSGT